MIFRNYLICCLLFFSVHSIFGYDVDPVGKKVKSAVQKYKTGDYNGSLDTFNEISPELKNDERLEFNKGTTYYKLNDYPSALKHFEKSLQTNDKDLKVRTLYNMGNTHYKQGDKISAIKSYLDALNLDPNFEPARKNLELIRKKEDKQNNNNNQNNEDENEEKDQNKNPNSSNNQNSPKKQKPKGSDEKDPENEKKLSKAEADRILESARQDQIKRRKLKERKPDYESMFW